jgi:hypothetical protein
MIVSSFEDDRDYGEEELEKVEDEEAPHPSSMVAASFEAGQDHEEEKREEGEDAQAPRPPLMMAEECLEIVTAGHEARKKPHVSIQDGVAPQVPEKQNALAREAEENISSAQDVVDLLRQGVDDNNGTPMNTGNQGSLLNPSSSSNVQIGAPSIPPTPQTGDEPCLAANNQGHVEISICSTEELMPPPWPNYDNSQQLPPLLEATLVQDVPQEPVYNAV